MTTPRAVDDVVLVQEQAINSRLTNYTSGGWRTRTLNTLVQDTGSHCSLSSYQITLDAGIYDAWFYAMMYQCDNHICRLQDITNSITLLGGSCEYADSTGDAVNSSSRGSGRFTLSSSTTIELQTITETTNYGGQGGGIPGFTLTDIYAEVFLRKVPEE